ncbi:MAG: Lipopolysaccharide export system permease protein LptG [Stenotrophomonas maltophilia]|uniref:Lipopolysaccharide export system permease protein LptG n=1 Tax=Stenotrophomonas maltophilia TaxID=40324 RepID=A0A7V8FER2_STEMA|nr:MAG: Lipopolysaccharide export system permease protein LptG [Stenotrophomonas maltophilia]
MSLTLRPMHFDFYLGRAVFGTVLLTWAVLVGLDVVMAFSGEFKDVGKGSYTLGHAAAWVLYTVPRRAYTFFPTAAVIGALMGLGQLAATSELTALRALGLSRKRLSVSVAVALSLLTALMVVNAETLGPWAQDRADNIKITAKSGSSMAVARYSGLWAREGDTFLNAQGGEEQLAGDKGTRLVLHGVRLYRVAADGRITSITHADSAQHDSGGWTLTGVREDTFGERSATRREVASEPWNSRLDAGALATGLSKPRNLTLSELSTSIEYRKRNGLDSRDYQDIYWSRWFYPVNVLALCLAAVPFAFGSLRSGGMGKRLFLGILFALGFWLLQLFFGRMAGALKFDYRIAYALPPIVMMGVSGLLFRRKSG